MVLLQRVLSDVCWSLVAQASPENKLFLSKNQSSQIANTRLSFDFHSSDLVQYCQDTSCLPVSPVKSIATGQLPHPCSNVKESKLLFRSAMGWGHGVPKQPDTQRSRE